MVLADVKPYNQSDGQLEPRGGLNKEVELGSHGELDNPLLQVSTVGSLGTVFVSVPRATVQRASCFAPAGEVPDTLTSAVLVVAALFFFCFCFFFLRVGALWTSYSYVSDLGPS